MRLQLANTKLFEFARKSVKYIECMHIRPIGLAIRIQPPAFWTEVGEACMSTRGCRLSVLVLSASRLAACGGDVQSKEVPDRVSQAHFDTREEWLCCRAV